MPNVCRKREPFQHKRDTSGKIRVGSGEFMGRGFPTAHRSGMRGIRCQQTSSFCQMRRRILENTRETSPENSKRYRPIIFKHFSPTSERTEYFLHFTGNRKLYFEKKKLENNWCRKQAFHGNIFCEMIKREWITLSEQSYFRTVQPLAGRIAELEKEFEALKYKHFTLQKMIDREKPKLEEKAFHGRPA